MSGMKNLPGWSCNASNDNENKSVEVNSHRAGKTLKGYMYALSVVMDE